MAKAKFRGQAETLLSAKEFPETIRELYRSTLRNDRGLRDIMSYMCAQRRKIIVDSSDLNAIMFEIREFELDILRDDLKDENRRLEESYAINVALKEHENEKQVEILRLQRQLGAVKRGLKRVVRDVEAGTISKNIFLFRD